MNPGKAAAIGLAALLLSAVLAPGALADGRQTWYLDDDEVSGPGGADRIMFRSQGGGAVNDEHGYVLIPDGGHAMWRGDEPALTDVSFGHGTWKGKMMLVRDEGDKGEKGEKGEYALDAIVLQLGYVAASGMTIVGETPLGDEKWHKWGDFYEIDFDLDAEGFTVPQGHYLALKVVNNSDKAVPVRTGSSHSWIKSPVEDPGYPVPELSAVVLLSGGLAGLAGYLALRRRRTGISSRA